ncbi:MAG: CHAT domain-containing protein [bacterium]|nr:CHAT domain-containing protein [bacterium]
MLSAPRVFISYSHESSEHGDRVLALADRLRQDGIDAQLDQYLEAPPQGWQLWMEDEIEAADFVLVVATETYERRRRGRERSAEGLGVRFEGAILSEALYDRALHNETVIPIVFAIDDRTYIPVFLRTTTCYDLSTNDGYQALYRRLTNQPKVLKPKLGKLKELPSHKRHSQLKSRQFYAERGPQGTSVTRPDQLPDVDKSVRKRLLIIALTLLSATYLILHSYSSSLRPEVQDHRLSTRAGVDLAEDPETSVPEPKKLLRPKPKPPPSSSDAEKFHRVGNEQFKNGDIFKAISSLNASAELWRSLRRPQELALVECDLARVYFQVSEFEQALTLYNSSISSLLQPNQDGEPVTDSAALSEYLHERGVLQLALGNTEAALQDLENALAMQEGLNQQDLMSSTLVALARIKREAGELEDAEALLNRSRTILLSQDDPERLADNLLETGVVLSGLGRGKEALAVLSKALAVAEGTGDRLLLAKVRMRLGAERLNQGQVDRSLVLLGEALAEFKRLDSPSDEALTLKIMAEAEYKRGRLTESRIHIESALSLIERTRSRVGRAKMRLSFLSTNQAYYDLAIAVLMQQHEGSPSAGFDSKAFEMSERSRARFLLDLIQGEPVIPKPQNSKLAQDLDRTRQLIETLDAQKQRFLQGGSTHDLLETNKKLKEEQRRHADLLQSVRSTESLVGAEPASLNEIQAYLLDKDTLLLEYHLAAGKSYLWAITRGSIDSYALPEEVHIQSLSRKLYRSISTATGRPEKSDRTRRQLENLGSVLLAPVADKVKDARRILVVSDGILHLIPFNALRVAALGEVEALVNYCEIVHAPSAASVLSLRMREANRPQPTKNIAVIADPVYSRDDPRVSEVEQPPKKGLPPVRQYEGKLERLVYSGKEADAIIDLAESRNNIKITGLEANTTFVLSGALSDYRLLHFATHSIIDPDNPEMSAVALSAIGKDGFAGPGMLRMLDIYSLDLPASLVVLSACETALGSEFDGEGRVGLAYAFMSAGSTRIVASLWRVSDEATAEFMTRFYEELLRGGKTPAEALRFAQLSFKQHQEWGQPYFWAGFILQGEWRGIVLD